MRKTHVRDWNGSLFNGWVFRGAMAARGEKVTSVIPSRVVASRSSLMAAADADKRVGCAELQGVVSNAHDIARPMAWAWVCYRLVEQEKLELTSFCAQSGIMAIS